MTFVTVYYFAIYNNLLRLSHQHSVFSRPCPLNILLLILERIIRTRPTRLAVQEFFETCLAKTIKINCKDVFRDDIYKADT